MLSWQDHPLVKTILDWATTETPWEPPKENYCRTRDILDARILRLRSDLTQFGYYSPDMSLLLHAVLSEIGGNSFDHNLGQWKDIPGVFFGKQVDQKNGIVILADRGQGVRTTLQRVVSNIQSDSEALHVAFLQRISSRAPEQRGNGLKFVRKTIMEDGIDLHFQSGNAIYEIQKKEENWKNSDTNVPGCLAMLSFTAL